MIRYRYVVATVVLVLCWGSTFAAVKIGLRDCSPMIFAGLRSLLAGALIGAVALARGGRPRLRAQAGTYALLTLFNVVGFLGLQSLAIQHLPSGISAVLIYLQPVLTAVLAGPLLGERVGLLAGIGLVVAFAGIVVVSTSAMGGHVSAAGIGYAVGCAAAWSLGTIVFKRQAGVLDARWAVAIPFLGGGLVLSALGYGTEDVTRALDRAFRRRPGVHRRAGHGAGLAAVVRAGVRAGVGPGRRQHLLRPAGRGGDRRGRAGRAVAGDAGGRFGVGGARACTW